MSVFPSMAGTVLRGLRSRAVLAVGSVLLVALAVASAVLGPSYAVAVTNAYAVTRLDATAVTATGVTRTLVAAERTGRRPAADAPAQRRALLDAVTVAAQERDRGAWRAPQVQLESARYNALRGLVTFLAREDACEHLDITGRCPTAAGEVVMVAADLERAGGTIGKPLDLDVYVPESLRDQYERSPVAVRVVGTYQLPEGRAVEEFWFNRARMAPTPERVTDTSYTPYQPAPLVTVPETFDAIPVEDWVARADSVLDVTPALSVADVDRAAEVSGTWSVTPEEIGAREMGTDELGTGVLTTDQSLLDLSGVAADVRNEQQTAFVSVTPAVISLVLVALTLLLRLLGAASDLRVPELALASLRGVGSRGLWLLGLAEPVAALLLAVPIGVAGGVLGAHGIARAWLLPELPVPFPAASWWAAVLVVLGVVGVAVLAVGTSLRRSLAGQLTGVNRPRTASRWGAVGQLVLVAAAVAALASRLAADPGSEPDLLDLVLPVLLAVVAGLAATRAVARLAGAWVRRVPGGPLAPWVAVRALARRGEGTVVILPLAVAVAVAVFAVGVSSAASDWRSSVASTRAPTGTVWASNAGIADTAALTRRLDPDGTWLMAAAEVPAPGTSFSVVDADRMAAVLQWPSSWSPDRTPAQVADAIASPGQVPMLSGRRLTVQVRNDVRSEKPVMMEVRLGERGGVPQRVYVGPFEPGTSTASVDLPACPQECPVEGITVAAGAGTTMVMDGTFTLTGLEVDGTPVQDPWSRAGWVASPDTQAASAILRVAPSPDGLELTLDSDGAPALARLSTGGLTAQRPVARGLDVDDADLARLDGSGLPPVRAVLDLEGTPFLGPVGLLVDRVQLQNDRPLYDNLARVRVLERDGAPDDLGRELAAAGLHVETTWQAEKEALDSGGYAMALRLYGIVALLVLVMALAGLVVSTAVQLPARRRDAAALRVVGVPRRTVLVQVAVELGVVLSGAALAGIAAGTVAQLVVLRTITLGQVDDLSTPHLTARVDGWFLLGAAAVCALVLGAVALVSALLTVRGARGSTLRESTR